jgi:hypothetical protein
VLLPAMHVGKPGLLDVMSTGEEHILRILREANETLFPYEITGRPYRAHGEITFCTAADPTMSAKHSSCSITRKIS